MIHSREDDSICWRQDYKKAMAKVIATSFGVQFIWMSTSYSKIIKSKHIATVHVYKSEQDFVSKCGIKTQPPLFKTVQF